MKTDQSCPAPGNSDLAFGKLAVWKMKEMGIWPQRKEICFGFSLEIHNVMKHISYCFSFSKIKPFY